MTSRTLCIAVACLLAAAATVQGQVAGQASVDITQFPGVVREGTDATFTCELTGFVEQETIVNYNKAVVSIISDLQNHRITEQISQSTQLTALYKKLQRYSIERITIGDKLVFKLHIKGVKPEDSGWYSCSAVHDAYGTKYAVKQLEVYRLPQVRLSFNETVTGYPERRLEWNDTLTFTEGDRVPIHCISERVLPIPDLELWITDGSKESVNPLIAGRPIGALVDRWRQVQGEEWRNVKDKYLTATEDNIYCDSLPGTAAKGDCPLHFDYTYTATPRDFTADARYDEKLLTCLVTMRDFERDQAIATVTLNVQYKPKLRCESVATSLVKRLVCIVTANPRVVGTENKTWTEGSCSQSGIPITDSSKYILSQEPLSSSLKNITLILQFRNATNLNQKFCLRVTNDLGTTSYEMVYKDPASPGRPGAASTLTSSSLLLAAAALLLLLRQA